MIHALLTILVVCNLMGWIFRRLGQPAVIGEMVGGLLLGPSFLGSFFPGFQQLLIPPSSFGSLGSLASLGVVLYMFLVGLEFDSSQLKGQQKPAWVISPTSVLVPIILGVLLAAVLYDIYSSPEIPFLNFALFIGVSMSVTAFPVLARILKERNMSQSPLGLLALDWAFGGFVILVAIGGKFGGTLVASRLTGLNWKDASILGVLMNTRGLVELVVLNVGLDLGILSPRLFSILVIMALVTTFMTSPILSFIHRLQGPKTYDI